MKTDRFLQITLLILLPLVLAGCMIAGICIGEVSFSPGQAFRLLLSSEESPAADIVRQLRFPRVVLGLVVGGSLSLSGVILQGIFRNPLVEPYTLGISGGASVGVATVIVLGLPALAGSGVLPLAGFAGALLTVALVYLFGIRRGRLHIRNLLLTGVMISFIASSLMMFILATTRTENLYNIIYWVMGSLKEPDTRLIGGISITALILLAGSWFYAPTLNALRLGHEAASQLGINTTRSVKVLFLLSSILTGLCVSISGVIGFVGLIIPQLMRYFTGGDYRFLLPASFLGGSIFLILSDILARTIIYPNELPIGVITGLVGGVLFILIMGSDQKERSDAG